jgi:hypothetical protein
MLNGTYKFTKIIGDKKIKKEYVNQLIDCTIPQIQILKRALT